MNKMLNVYLTDRDRTILSLILLFRIMKTSQVCQLFFPSYRSCAARLLDLKNAGYLNAIQQRSARFHGENIWQITRKGLEEAKEWLTYKHRPFSTRNLTVEPIMFPHDLQIVQVFVELVKRGICTVDDLMNGQFLETRSADVPISSYQNKIRLKPDARFKKGDRWYWIEIDRGTERLSAIRAKIQRYKAFLDTGEEGKHVVIFLTENGRPLSNEMYSSRIDNIRLIASKQLGSYALSERLEWYTFDISEGIEVFCNRLIHLDYINQVMKRLVAFTLEDPSVEGYQLKRMDPKFVPTAMTPAAWFGIKRIDDKGQFYVVENLIGGASGGLYRLQYFSIQQHEFLRTEGGVKPKLLLIIQTLSELRVVLQTYPELKEDLMYLTLEELFSEGITIDWVRRGSNIGE